MNTNREMLVIMAHEILQMNRENLEMQDELQALRGYREKYNELVASSINHSNTMMHNMMDALIHPEKYRNTETTCVVSV